MDWLKTIPDKINKYLPKWEYLFIVLFDINIVEYKSKEENMKIYIDKKKEIVDNILESKKDKVFFIEI
jgi:dsDNA-binding SOS-regulon protein